MPTKTFNLPPSTGSSPGTKIFYDACARPNLLPRCPEINPINPGSVKGPPFIEVHTTLPKPEGIAPANTPHGEIDIDALIAEFEQTPVGARAVAEGRQWVAETFYGDQPPSIAKLRLQRGWSQAELAKRAATSQSHIARLELGQGDPRIGTLKKLARALGVPLATVVQAICPEDPS
jgi:DNA-binding XRE family transcriptional regulator